MNIFKNRGPLTFVAAMGVFLAGIVLGLSSTASAQSNLVYVGSNIGSVPNMNSVFVFSNDGAGNLTQIAGSPFLTNGTGWYDPNLTTSSLDADHAVIIDPTGSFLYTVNSHSNTVSSFSIAAGGSLSLLSSSNPAGGKEPVSLAQTPNVLSNGNYVLAVANKDQDPNQTGGVPNIQSFTGNSLGMLTPVLNGANTFAVGDFLASVNTTPLLPKNVFGVQLLPTSAIYTYKVNPQGKLVQVSSIGPPVSGDLLLGMGFHPTAHVVYVGLPNVGMIAVYNYSASGTLKLAGTVANPGVAVCWFAINSAGTRLYSVESNTGSVTVYDITTPTAPVQTQHVVLTNQPQQATNAVLDPTGKFLYVLGSASPNGLGPALLQVLSVDQTSGMLTELNAVTLNEPTGDRPSGLATLIK